MFKTKFLLATIMCLAVSACGKKASDTIFEVKADSTRTLGANTFMAKGNVKITIDNVSVTLPYAKITRMDNKIIVDGMPSS